MEKLCSRNFPDAKGSKFSFEYKFTSFSLRVNVFIFEFSSSQEFPRKIESANWSFFWCNKLGIPSLCQRASAKDTQIPKLIGVFVLQSCPRRRVAAQSLVRPLNLISRLGTQFRNK